MAKKKKAKKTYKKTHTLKRAVDGHEKAIEKRGGKILRKNKTKSGNWIIEYSFPKSKK